MERVTFEEYEAAKAEVLYGKEYEETSSICRHYGRLL